MASHLFGAKPLSKPIMISHQSHPNEQASMKKLSKLTNFSLTKLHCKLSSLFLPPFCPVRDESSTKLWVPHALPWNWKPYFCLALFLFKGSKRMCCLHDTINVLSLHAHWANGSKNDCALQNFLFIQSKFVWPSKHVVLTGKCQPKMPCWSTAVEWMRLV